MNSEGPLKGKAALRGPPGFSEAGAGLASPFVFLFLFPVLADPPFSA